MKIQYINTISERDYSFLFRSVGWDPIPTETAQTGLDNSEYIVAAISEGKTIGMARIISDGGYVRYIADVVVHPEYQGCGIGRTMLNRIMEHIRNGKREGEKVLVCLMAAKGKEPFYKKCGLEERPNEGHGAGMSQWV